MGQTWRILLTVSLILFHGSVQTICISQKVVLYESDERLEVAMDEMDGRMGAGLIQGEGMHYH